MADLTFRPATPEELLQAPQTPKFRPATPEELAAPKFRPATPEELSAPPKVWSVQELRQEYGRGFVQKDFMEDDRLMAIVDADLAARYPDEGGFVQGAVDAVTGLAGGSTLSGWKKLDRKGRFELWQNHQRSFAGGQTVTTANEIHLVTTADDKTKAAMGSGYELFGEMENIFFGDNVSWGDMFDGFRDYASAAVWDPTTLLGFGVGRAYTYGGSRAAAASVRLGAKTVFKETLEREVQKGVAKTVAQAAARTAEKEFLSKGLKEIGKQAAAQAAKEVTVRGVLKDAAAYGAVDLVSSIGTDIAYQNVLIEAGAQKEYSYAQTGLSALGMLALPGIVYAGKGMAGVIKGASKNTKLGKMFQQYQDVAQRAAGMSPNQITGILRAKVNLDQVASDLTETFSKFARFKSRFDPWTESVATSKKFVKGRDLGMTDEEVNQLFWKTFLFGEPSKSASPSITSKLKKGLGLRLDTPDIDPTVSLSKGYIQAMVDNGLAWVPRFEDDKITNFIADSIAWLPPKVVKQMRKDFEAATGKKLDFLTSPKAMAAAYEARLSFAGQVLSDSSVAKQVFGGKKGGSFRTIAEELGGGSAKDLSPDRLHYFQSVWKRLVTSHPGTTGLNVKGWAATSALNTLSDFVQGSLNLGHAGLKRMAGDQEGAAQLVQAAKGSVLGAVKRGYRILDPNATKVDFDNLMAMIPKTEEELFRELAGDVGPSGAAARFNMPESKITSATEIGVDKIQGLMGVKLQDEITKQLSFMSAFDQELMKKYGKTFNEFVETNEGLLALKSDKFYEDVIGPALDRTLRETYSKAWSRQQGKSLALNVAKGVEKISSHQIAGYFIPFGKFFNTSMATIGDYSGLNFARHLLKRAFNDEVSWAHESGTELLSKAIVGWAAIFAMSLESDKKLENGLAWNQQMESDGSIKDVTYDFPESIFHAVGQLLAHVRKDGEVPKDLAVEVVEMAVGQTFRASEGAVKELTALAVTVAELSLEDAGSELLKAALATTGKVASGLTRPLDPINTAAMMYTEDYETADRRQGAKWWNEATRYIDKLIPETILYGGVREKRNSPTRPKENPNIGKVLGGVRETGTPTPIESLLNSVGVRSWDSIKWDGSPEVKNRLDQIVEPILNTNAQRALSRYPDFFERDLASREQILEGVVRASQQEAKRILQLGMGEDGVLNVMMEIQTLPKKDVKRTLKRLGIDQDIEDLATQPGGKAILDSILYFSKNFDEVFNYDVGK